MAYLRWAASLQASPFSFSSPSLLALALALLLLPIHLRPRVLLLLLLLKCSEQVQNSRSRGEVVEEVGPCHRDGEALKAEHRSRSRSQHGGSMLGLLALRARSILRVEQVCWWFVVFPKGTERDRRREGVRQSLPGWCSQEGRRMGNGLLTQALEQHQIPEVVVVVGLPS